MGNLQTSDGGKGAAKGGQKSGARQKMRLLGGKRTSKTDDWVAVVPDDAVEDSKTTLSLDTTQDTPAQEDIRSRPLSR